LGESDFEGVVEGEVVALFFLVEVLFELELVEFFLLVPVAQFGVGGVAAADVVVMHAVIFIGCNRLEILGSEVLPVELVVQFVPVLFYQGL
jgi:hypothetical protein